MFQRQSRDAAERLCVPKNVTKLLRSVFDNACDKDLDNFMQLYDRRPARTQFLIPENLARFYRRFVSIHTENISLRLIKQRIKWNIESIASARSAKCID